MGNKYSIDEIIAYLGSHGSNVENYIVILAESGRNDMLYYLHENHLFLDLIDDDVMHHAVIDYVKQAGRAYTRGEFKQKFPQVYLD